MTHVLTDNLTMLWWTAWLLCFQMTHLLTENLTMLSDDSSVDRQVCFWMTHLLTYNSTMLSDDSSADRQVCFRMTHLLKDNLTVLWHLLTDKYAFKWLVCWHLTWLGFKPVCRLSGYRSTHPVAKHDLGRVRGSGPRSCQPEQRLCPCRSLLNKTDVTSDSDLRLLMTVSTVSCTDGIYVCTLQCYSNSRWFFEAGRHFLKEGPSSVHFLSV